MALSMLSGDQQRSVFHRVCNLLDPRDAGRDAVAFTHSDGNIPRDTN